MSIREEQCQKVCRILDDVLANRPTERDSLIVATRSAFSALSEPHWIPVTERLPETGQDVELCCGYKNYRGEIVRYICIAYHVNRYEMKSSADWDEGCDEYREEDDEYYILEGWYERIHNWDTYGAVKIYDLALAWRELPKLPEPYKGVTE